MLSIQDIQNNEMYTKIMNSNTQEELNELFFIFFQNNSIFHFSNATITYILEKNFDSIFKFLFENGFCYVGNQDDKDIYKNNAYIYFDTFNFLYNINKNNDWLLDMQRKESFNEDDFNHIVSFYDEDYLSLEKFNQYNPLIQKKTITHYFLNYNKYQTLNYKKIFDLIKETNIIKHSNLFLRKEYKLEKSLIQSFLDYLNKNKLLNFVDLSILINDYLSIDYVKEFILNNSDFLDYRLFINPYIFSKNVEQDKDFLLKLFLKMDNNFFIKLFSHLILKLKSERTFNIFLDFFDIFCEIDFDESIIINKEFILNINYESNIKKTKLDQITFSILKNDNTKNKFIKYRHILPEQIAQSIILDDF